MICRIIVTSNFYKRRRSNDCYSDEFLIIIITITTTIIIKGEVVIWIEVRQVACMHLKAKLLGGEIDRRMDGMEAREQIERRSEPWNQNPWKKYKKK